MAFQNLKQMLKGMHPGVGLDRIEVRTQGCWNCTHWQLEKAADLWWKEARTKLLNRAVQLALNSPQGENNQVVRNIRGQVPQFDHAIHTKKLGCCSVGKDANGNPVGDFVFSTFLCGQWTATEGASVAREGQAADKLPEELMDRMVDKPITD
jgi:hypothetical protein